MAYFSWVDATSGESESGLLEIVADNLLKYFGDLPDSRVVHGLARPERRDQLFNELLAVGELPVLARSAHALAAFAAGRGYADSPVVAASRRSEAGQVWLIDWNVGVGVRGMVTPQVAPT
jgi:hypothetical protein